MKKLINLLFFISIVLFASCSPEEKDLFDDSSSNRMDARLKADMEVLTGATNGWLMEYYPAPGMIYGGYNVLVTFTKDYKVVVSSDVTDASATATSTYRLKDSAGPVLTFDTYNDIFHIFSDPVNPMGIGSNGKGMEGDFEFTIMEATPERVMLKGKKTGNKIVMTPLKKEAVWSDVLTPLAEMGDILSNFSKYEYVDGTFTAAVSASYNVLNFAYLEDGNEQTFSLPYILTATGLKFNSPLELNGKKISGLNFQENEEDGILVPVDGGTVVLTPVFPLNGLFTSGEWYFSYKGLSAKAAQFWNIGKKTLDANKINLNFALFTPMSPGKTAFYWSATGFTDGFLSFDYTLKGDSQIWMKFGLAGNNVGVTFYNNLNWVYMIEPFSGGTKGKTFTLTADDPKKPTVVTMTEDADKANTITLYQKEILNPFEN